MRLLASTVLAVAVAAMPAFAQTSGAPKPYPAYGEQDAAFVREAAAGGATEVEFGKLAQQRASSPKVKDFAARMVADHTKSNERLAELAKGHNVPLQEGLNQGHKKNHEQLVKLTGANFDRVYIDHQIQDHKMMVQLLEWQMSSGKDPDLKQFATETLATVKYHLKMAEGLAIQPQMSKK